MDSDQKSRRHLLRAGALGLATSIAGCNRSGVTRREPGEPVPEGYKSGGTSTPSPDTDEKSHEMPESPPAVFRGPSAEYPFFHLPIHEKLTDPDNIKDAGGLPPDSRVFHIEVTDEITAVLTISEVNVERSFDLTLHVRDDSNTYHERTATVEPTNGDQFTTVTREFDLSGIDIPTMKGGFMELVAEDTHPGNPYTFLAKRHQYVGIPHKNGVEWMNSEAFNPNRFIKNGQDRTHGPQGVQVNSEWVTKWEKPGGAIKTIDGPEERTLLLAVRSPGTGEVYGVSCHISHDAYNDYVNGDEQYQRRYNYPYEGHYATEISHLQELAIKSDEAITSLGITAPHRRTQVLGDLVQMIPYSFGTPKSSLTTVLYEMTGNCSLKSALLAAILRNKPWNQMHGFIRCQIEGIGHLVVGIDVRTLGDSFDRHKAFTVRPTERQIRFGFPDTEYAFFDMTYDSWIGERRSNVTGVGDKGIYVYEESDFSHTGPGHPNDPPDY